MEDQKNEMSAPEEQSGSELQAETMSPLQEELDKAKSEINDLKDKYVRLLAEFENFRKRTLKEKEDLNALANRDMMVSLLDILDNIERSEKHESEHQDPEVKISEGQKLVFQQFKNLLQQKGLRAMDCKGKDFDVELHEAITQIDAGTEMTGKVVDELVKGYYLNDKIIRFAKVVVGI